MASWVLECLNCNQKFEYSKISASGLINYFQPLKPEMPPDGVQMQCPNCGQNGQYFRHQLTYRT
ncbi:MAG: hypothetical protein ABSG16_01880 [Candidatus Acidiferrum sp.]|jgi:hypothetical protein